MKAAFVWGLLLAPAWSQAMCVATAQTLIEVEVYTCQYLELHASPWKGTGYPLRHKGSKLKGSLISGLVLDATLVWSGPQHMAPTSAPRLTIAKGERILLMVPEQAAKLCPAIVGQQQTIVTKMPCCDTFPASGLCLVPRQIPIGVLESNPGQWYQWYPTEPE